MRYSLLSRFRGTLLGSFVGEILDRDLGRVLGESTLRPPEPGNDKPSPILSDWSQIATCGTKSLIRCGRLDVEDWLLHSTNTQSSFTLLKRAATSNQAAVATLPIALFFHDDEIKLRQQLLAGAAVWQQESEGYEGILAVGYAIAQALTEKLDPTTLIPRILVYLGTSQTPVVQQLEQVQTLLEQGAGLDTTFTQLRREAQRRGESLLRPHTSIALAFYCFLSTPEHFHLCVSRAARISYQPLITAALTGALAGAYNSSIGIPMGWRLATNQINLGSERLQLADRLFASWSGVYDVSTAQLCHRAAVAAPRVIQPR